jgi:hypothetical protein
MEESDSSTLQIDQEKLAHTIGISKGTSSISSLSLRGLDKELQEEALKARK